MDFFREYGLQLRTSRNRRAHFYTGAYIAKKEQHRHMSTGAVWRHDIPIKRLCSLALQSTIFASVSLLGDYSAVTSCLVRVVAQMRLNRRVQNRTHSRVRGQGQLAERKTRG